MFLFLIFLSELFTCILSPQSEICHFRIIIWAIIPVICYVVKARKTSIFIGNIILLAIYLFSFDDNFKFQIEYYYMFTTTYIILFSIFETKFNGKTLGKKLFEIEVIGETELSFSDYLYRNYFKFFGLFIWPISLYLYFKNHEFWWDTICKTELLEVTK